MTVPEDEILDALNGFTSDGSGVELIGIEQPLTLYVPKTELASRFVALDSRQP
jgi:hypothetical protein